MMSKRGTGGQGGESESKSVGESLGWPVPAGQQTPPPTPPSPASRVLDFRPLWKSSLHLEIHIIVFLITRSYSSPHPYPKAIVSQKYNSAMYPSKTSFSRGDQIVKRCFQNEATQLTHHYDDGSNVRTVHSVHCAKCALCIVFTVHCTLYRPRLRKAFSCSWQPRCCPAVPASAELHIRPLC